MQADAVQAAAGLRAAFDAFAACEFGSLSRAELMEVLDEYEALSCQLPSVWHRLLAQLQTDTTPRELGAKSWNEVLRIRWRLSSAEAGRRLGEAAELGPRRALTGEPLPPVLPVMAAAQSAGLINPDHVKVLRDAIKGLPTFVDQATREQFEADLVRVAVGVGPKELKETAELRLFLLDQDGPEPDDTERARKRGVTMSKQGRDAMTALTANLTPEAAAVMEVLFAKFAAPGMCNPDDDEPCTCGTPTQEQIDNDHRSLAQRQHDALLVIGRIALMTDLGQLNGLPVSIIIRTTLQDLERRAGIGVSGGGVKLPISDVIRMAGHANHHLAIFDEATGAALNYFRGRRIASPAQRIMLIARDGGCTKPCCTVGAYGTQVHHAVADWADGGNTNIDEMALACGPDNRLVNTDGGYTTSINRRGEVEWQPPPGLDHGQNRINYHHRPELLLTPPEQDDPDGTPGAARGPRLVEDLPWEWEQRAHPKVRQDLESHNEFKLDPESQNDPEPELKRNLQAEHAPEAMPGLESQPGCAPAEIPEPAAAAENRDREPEPDEARAPEWTPEWDLKPEDLEQEPDPEWDLTPDLAQVLAWEQLPDWASERDNTFDPSNVEYFWDTESFTPESSGRCHPPNNHAPSGKAVRGP